MIPPGKGMFTWIIERCGEPVALARKAKAGGCNHILVKLADGVLPYYGRNYASPSTRDFTMELVAALRDEGIEPIAWQYVYGNSPTTEAQIIVSRMNQAGLKKLIVNAEVEYKRPGMGSKAVQYCQKLKSEMSEIRLGLSSFRFPTYHQEFPWGEFGQFMECYMPQVYWQGAHNPVEQLDRCLHEYKDLPYPNLPIYPTGAAYKDGGWVVLPGEDTVFMNAAKNIYGLTAVNFWEWYNATVYLPYCWNEISAFEWGAISPPPPPVLRLRVNVASLNIRSAPIVTAATQIGYTSMGKIWEVEDTVFDSQGRPWHQVGQAAFLAGWLCVPI